MQQKCGNREAESENGIPAAKGRPRNNITDSELSYLWELSDALSPAQAFEKMIDSF
jgi:hypothetical protein